jgi:hypothetical protein
MIPGCRRWGICEWGNGGWGMDGVKLFTFDYLCAILIGSSFIRYAVIY